jgi:hypothetical protein
MALPAHRAAIAVYICLLSQLIGCAHLHTPIAPAPAPTAAASPPPLAISAADRTLRELTALYALPAAELVSVRDTAREAFERDNTEARRLRYLLTLIASTPSPSDDDRIISLAAHWLMTPPPAAAEDNTRALVTFAEQAALERKRLRAEQAGLRARNTALQQTARRDERDAELRALRTRIEDLEKQLLVMKSIDRSVARR